MKLIAIDYSFVEQGVETKVGYTPLSTVEKAVVRFSDNGVMYNVEAPASLIETIKNVCLPLAEKRKEGYLKGAY